jgi:S-adenosylmethionine:tRNA ribosyltransferase-isomerase
MTNVKEIGIADFDYNLPDERIARHPLLERDKCKLIVSRSSGEIEHTLFNKLPDLLSPATLMVCNNTKVINARMRFRKPTGAEIEVFLLDPEQPSDYAQMFQSRGECSWQCLVGNLKRWKEGELTKELTIADSGQKAILKACRKQGGEGTSHIVTFSWTPADLTFATIVEAAGFIPIPPYLHRESEQCDADDYQTVYSKIQGSVAAPTAGLHFTPQLMESIRANGVEIKELTLHVGAGTFQPVKSETIGEHPMHTETFELPQNVLKSIIDAISNGRPVTAVGTTSVRTLESLPYLYRHLNEETTPHVTQWEAYGDDTDFDTLSALSELLKYMQKENIETLTASTAIMIAPGFNWRIVDALVTNFHQPQSTLLLLVSSFLQRNKPADQQLQWRKIYTEALQQGYRFLSYGDASLLFPLK